MFIETGGGGAIQKDQRKRKTNRISNNETKRGRGHRRPTGTRPITGNDHKTATRQHGRRTGGLPKARGIQFNISASSALDYEVSFTSREEGIHESNK